MSVGRNRSNRSFSRRSSINAAKHFVSATNVHYRRIRIIIITIRLTFVFVRNNNVRLINRYWVFVIVRVFIFFSCQCYMMQIKRRFSSDLLLSPRVIIVFLIHFIFFFFISILYVMIPHRID